jgi:hypothetical protein
MIGRRARMVLRRKRRRRAQTRVEVSEEAVGGSRRVDWRMVVVRSWMSLPKMRERMKAATLMVAVRMLLCLRVERDWRDIISVSRGCLNVPGDGFGRGVLAGVEGAEDDVGTVPVGLAAVVRDMACEAFGTSAVEVVDMADAASKHWAACQLLVAYMERAQPTEL